MGILEKINNWSKRKKWLKQLRWFMYSRVISKYGVTVYYLENERQRIMKLIHRIKKESDMLLGDTEAYTIYMSVKNTKKIPGDIAEVGSYRGGSAKLICKAKGNKTLHVFDTFEGLPEISIFDKKSPVKKRDYPAVYESVKKYLSKYSNVRIYKGLFPTTAKPIINKRFSFVNLDTDLYESTLSGLKFFYPRMNTGGIIISHDYFGCPGVKKAVDEFFHQKKEPVVEIPGTQCLVVKV